MDGANEMLSSLRRRQALLDAAVELLAEHGTRGVSHRRTAERVGLTTASSRHYFPTDDGLLHAALRHRLQRWQAEIGAAFESAASSDMDVPTMVSRYFQARRPEDAAVNLAVFSTAFTIPELQSAVRAATLQIELLLERRLSALGLPAPEHLARTMLALTFGAAVRRRDGRRSDAQEAAVLANELANLIDGHVRQHSSSPAVTTPQ